MTTLEQAIPIAIRSTREGGSLLWRLAVALAAYLALASLAAHEVMAEAAAETAALGLLAAAVLLPAAALARQATEVGVGAVLVVAACWVLPHGPGREAVAVAALLAVVVVAGGRRLAAAWPELPFAVALPLALAAQALLRAEVLLPPEIGWLGLRLPVIVVALPAAAALATVRLARRHGAGPALVAAATALLLGPGWNVATTLALVALAAGDVLADRTVARTWRLAAGIALLAPLVWEPRAGALTAGAGLALAAGRWAPAVGLLVALPLATVFSLRPPGEALAWLVWLPLLVPGALLPAPERRRTALAALALAVGAAAGAPAAAGLAPALALAALGMRRQGAPLAAQGTWTGVLLGTTALLAAPPWLRDEPLAAALALLVGAPGALAALGVVALWLLAGPVLARALRYRLGAPRRVARPAAVLAFAAAVVSLAALLPPPGIAPLASDLTLTPAAPAWEAPLPGGDASVGAVVVGSALANSTALAPGRPVATVRLLDRAGRARTWTLHAARETDDWAAGRPDVVAQRGVPSPEPWLSWVVGDFLAQRYRARWDLPGAEPAARVRIERHADLPAEVLVTIHDLELRP